MIDLLTRQTAEAGDAQVTPDGVSLLRPWGALEQAPLTLAAGWYVFSVMGSAACLQLEEVRRFRTIEMSATPQDPAFARLEAGIYIPKLLVGVRPGHYPLNRACLKKLNVLERFNLLAGRLSQALKRGVAPGRILANISLALKPGATFGLRARPGLGSTDLGVLCRQDIDHRPDVGRLAERLEALGRPPVIHISFPDSAVTAKAAAQIGLKTQCYPHYTLKASDPHDVTLYLGRDDVLTPDALLLVAETFHEHAETDLIVADAWIDGRPTVRVAFDPLLYHRGYPTPYVIRSGSRPETDWSRQKKRHLILPVPLVHTRSHRPETIDTTAPAEQPPVSIIIPTRDRADLLEACLGGLFEATAWPHEVIIVDNGSVEPATHALMTRYAEKGVRIVAADIAFNFSRLCNLGATAARHDYLVFLNNDVVLTDSDWLKHMMTLAMREEIGAIGAKLLYGDRRLQHGGIMLGLTQIAGHLWRGMAEEEHQKVERLQKDSLRSAVTAALLCVARHKFETVGGFDENDFPVTLNDVDLCLKLNRQGWFTAFAARAEALHLEGETRGEDSDPHKRARRQKELTAFAAKWPEEIANDPWLPPAVMRSTETFGLK